MASSPGLPVVPESGTGYCATKAMVYYGLQGYLLIDLNGTIVAEFTKMKIFSKLLLRFFGNCGIIKTMKIFSKNFGSLLSGRK